jgi:hypothetical protein
MSRLSAGKGFGYRLSQPVNTSDFNALSLIPISEIHDYDYEDIRVNSHTI